MNSKRAIRGTMLLIITISIISVSFSTSAAALWFWNPSEEVCETDTGQGEVRITTVSTTSTSADITLENNNDYDINNLEVAAFLGDKQIDYRNVSLRSGNSKVVTITGQNITFDKFMFITENTKFGGNEDYSGGCNPEKIGGSEENNEDWTIPDRIEDSGIGDAEYTDLWYGITVYGQDSEQYNILSDSIKENVGETPDSRILLQARSSYAKTSTYNPKDHTSIWNKELSQQPTDGDVSSYLRSDEIVSDTPVITSVGVDLMTVDPHTTYISPEGRHYFGTTSQRTTYINRDPTITAALSEYTVSARDDTMGDYPASSKTEYSIYSQNAKRKLIVEANGGEYRKVYNNVFDQGEVDTEDVEIPDSVEGGDEITFEIVFNVTATELEENYHRSVTRETNEKGEFTGYDFGEWEKSGSQKHNYNTRITDQFTATVYDPQVDIRYTKKYSEEKDITNSLVEIKNDQPIGGFTAVGYGRENRDPSIARYEYPNSFYSFSHPKYRGTFSSENILPVKHISTPSGTQVQKKTELGQQFSHIINSEGDTGRYSNPDNVNLPIEASSVTGVNTIEIYTQHKGEYFNNVKETRMEGYNGGEREDRIEIISLVPNTEIEPNTSEDEDGSITETEVEVVQSELTVQPPNDNEGNHTITITTTDTEGYTISTDRYRNGRVKLTVNGQVYYTNTDNGEATWEGDISDPALIEAKAVTNQEAAIENESTILIGEIATATTEAPQPGYTSAWMNIMTGIIRRFLWYVLPVVIVLSMITEALTDNWIAYDWVRIK